MISDPKYGWCKFQIEDFIGNPSYLTMVPIELLEDFIQYFKTGNIVEIYFDEEGTDFRLFLDSENLRIEKDDWNIETDEENHVVVPISKPIRDLALELILDIETDIKGWANFDYDENTEEKNKEKILELIQELKGLIK